MAKTPYHNISTRATPQSKPIPGTIPNSAGGHAFPVDDFTRLSRFLILGSEGGSYYASERKLTEDNTRTLMRCIVTDGPRVVRMITEISLAGRNPKQQPIMFALAACAGADPATRQAALAALPQVCRTGTHMFLFASYIEQFRGWGRSLRRAVGDWYIVPHATEPEADEDTPEEVGLGAEMADHIRWLTLQLAKYRQREGWSHRDLLRLSSPPHWSNAISADQFRGTLLEGALGWAVGKTEGKNVDSFLQAVDEAQEATAPRIIDLIEMFRLPWETIPSEKLADPAIWRALLPSMGLGALVRNLGRMTANGALQPMSDEVALVVSKLLNPNAVTRSRIHPLNVLIGAMTYGEGHGHRGKLSWTPIGDISDALDRTFRLAFPNVEAANKRTLIAIDVSGSMTISKIANTFLTPREGAAAMALVTHQTEPKSHVVAFSGGNGFRGDPKLVPVNITRRSTVRSVVRETEHLPFGRTDCSLPMRYATANKLEVDTFVIYTDSETWFGPVHPMQALQEYRQRFNPNARLITVGMVANEFTIGDPADNGTLDVVGFDSASPALIAHFSAGRI